MEIIAFRQLPMVVKIAVGLVFMNAWVMFEQLVVDHYGLWKYMPYYKVADACVWDLMAALIISISLWQASRHRAIRSAA